MKSRRLLMICALTSLVGLAPILSSCAGECKRLLGEWEEFLAVEPGLTTDTPDVAHFTITVRDELIDAWIKKVLTTQMHQALNFTAEVPVAAGRTVAMSAAPVIEELSLLPDSRCDSCIRLDARMEGDTTFQLPILGSQKVPLRGTIQIVAPVVFDTDAQGNSRLAIDLAEAARLGHSQVDAVVRDLPPTWSTALSSPLSRIFLTRLLEAIGTVPVLTLQTPDFGIEGLRLTPIWLATDEANGLFELGVATNLRSDRGMMRTTPTLPDGRNFQISFPPSIVGPAINSMMQAETISRRYDSDGNADGQGRVHVSMQEVKSTDDDSLHLGFSMWNLGSRGSCYRVDAVADIGVKVEGTSISGEIRDVQLVDSSLSGLGIRIADWRRSQFLKASERFFERSLGEDTLEFHGTAVRFEDAELSLSADRASLDALIRLE